MRSNPYLSKEKLKNILNYLLEKHFGEELKNISENQKQDAIEKYATQLTENGDFPRDELNPQKMLELAINLTAQLALEYKPLVFTTEEKAFIEERRKPENANKILTPQEQLLADSINKKLEDLQLVMVDMLLKNDMLKPAPGFQPALEPEPPTPGHKKKKTFIEQLAGIQPDDPAASPVHVYLGNFFNSINFNPNGAKDLSKVPAQDRMEQIVLGNPQGIVTNYERYLEEKNMSVDDCLYQEGLIPSRHPTPRP